jgi:hypothetical protein
MMGGVERAFSGGGAELFFQLGQFGVRILLRNHGSETLGVFERWGTVLIRLKRDKHEDHEGREVGKRTFARHMN